MVIMKKILCLLLAFCSLAGMVYGDLSWNTPVTISDAGVNASDPHTIIDKSGNATAVWVENNVIMASYMPSGGSWATPSALSNISNTASSPRLGIAGSGNVTAIWIESTQIESAVQSGGTWSAETSPISGTGASLPSLAVDSSGDVVAVWVRSTFIESATRKSGTWSSVAVLSAANSTNPNVAISSSFGQAIAAWQTITSGSTLIVTDILTVSSNTWAAAKNVFPASPAFLHNYPKVTMDPQGNSCLGWFRYNLVDSDAYENVTILVSTLTAGAASWSISQILDVFPGIRNPADLTIKMRQDSDGDVAVFWTNSTDGETFNIFGSQKLFGSATFSGASFLNFSIYSFGIDIGVGADTALVTYMFWDGVSTLSINAQEGDMNNPISFSFTSSNIISSGTENGYPSCSLSASGGIFNSVAVWLSYNGSNVVVNAATGTETQIAPPTGVSATQSSTDLGVYTDYYNTVTWTASSDPNVIQYNIYRNGVYFVSTPDASTFSIIDHNQIAGGTVTYGVAAYTSENRQSEVVTYTLFP
jgi:hypothetical protein